MRRDKSNAPADAFATLPSPVVVPVVVGGTAATGDDEGAGEGGADLTIIVLTEMTLSGDGRIVMVRKR